MRNDGVSDALDTLLCSDPDVADREQVGAMIRQASQIRGWVDAVDVRLTRRLRQLEAEGASEAAGMALTDEGRRSGREAKNTENREEICTSIPAFEDALATGAVSSDHLDALARLTKNLSDIERSDLHARADELVGSATSDYVSEFERKTRNIIDEIRTDHAPHDEAAELDRQRAESSVRSWVDKTSGMHKTLIECDPIRNAAVQGAIDAQLARLEQQSDITVPFGSLQVDAVIAAMSADQPGQPRVPEISVLIDANTLCDGRHADTICETSNGTPLPVSTVQRMCCDATMLAITLGSDGDVLNVGREHRTATRAQRRALRAMYRTCAHPHCAVAFDRCRIHHIIWWTNHGLTDLQNLLPLCEQHHHLVHEGHWTLTMTPNRTATWTRPDGTHWHTGPTINRTTPNKRTRDQRPSGAPPPTGPPADYRQPSLC